ncbi:MAG: DUF2683 family protein [Cyclonatronaceae bacterium]
MKTQDVLIVHPQTDEQLNAIKAFIKAQKIKFEVTNMEIYNSDFVQNIGKPHSSQSGKGYEN